MTCIAVRCPYCDSAQIVTRGKTHRGTQRSLCQNGACARGSLLLDYRPRGCVLEVKHHIIDMSLSARGVRDTARVLHLSTDTVLSELSPASYRPSRRDGRAPYLLDMWRIIA